MIELAFAAVAVALASAAAYLWRRQWINAALALVAGAALAGLVGGFSLSAGKMPAADAASGDVTHATTVTVGGDGLRAAQWHDLPARPLRWNAPTESALRLDFPHEVIRGRIFTLSVDRGVAGPVSLQLLAENGVVLAESKSEGKTVSVQWMPPVAESLVLKARLLGKDNKVLAEGPVPFRVTDSPPLRVQGRFGAPSFDAQALARLLQQSHAVLDWRVVLGKSITRAQTPREAIERPDVAIVDAAYVERLPSSARAQLMAQTAGGVPLVVLGANASDRSLWQREFQLALATQPEGTETRGELKMAVPALAAQAQGAWQERGERIASRPWQQGRITWLSLADWHRHAITEPKALALWWQQVVDAANVRRKVEMHWLAPAEMPLAGQRLEVCANGVQGSVRFPQLEQTLEWQRRPDKAGAWCVAVWPRKAGWLAMETGAKGAVRSAVYVYEDADWPAWQAAQRRDATAMYAARTPVQVPAGRTPLPEWPFALLFVAAMLALWWRERR